MGGTKAVVLGMDGVTRRIGAAAARGFIEVVPEVERGREGVGRY